MQHSHTKFHYPGQMLDLEMMRPIRGKMPISRANNGVICVLEHGTKGFFPYGSVWECEVIEIFEKKLIVRPVNQIKSQQTNASEILSKLNALKKERVKKQKPIRNYQYKASYER